MLFEHTSTGEEPGRKKSETAGWRPRCYTLLRCELFVRAHGRRARTVSANNIEDRGAVRCAVLLGGGTRLQGKVAARDKLRRASDRSGIPRRGATCSVPKVVRPGDVACPGLDVRLAARRLRADVVHKVDTGARCNDTEAAVLIANGVCSRIYNSIVIDLNDSAGCSRRVGVDGDAGLVCGAVGVGGERSVGDDVVEDFNYALRRIDRGQTDSIAVSTGDDVVMHVDVVEVGAGRCVEHDAAAVALEVSSNRIPAHVCVVDVRREVNSVVGLVYVAAGVVVVVPEKGPRLGRIRRLAKDAGRAAETRAWCRAGEVVVDDADVARLSVNRGVAADDVEIGDRDVRAPSMYAVAYGSSANVNRTTGESNDRELFRRRASTNVRGDAGVISASIVRRNVCSRLQIDHRVLRRRAVVIGRNRVERSAPGLERSGEATRIAVLTIGRYEDDRRRSHREGKTIGGLAIDVDHDISRSRGAAKLSNDGVVAPGAQAAICDERSAQSCRAAALRGTEVGPKDANVNSVAVIATGARTNIQIGVIDVGSGSRRASRRRSGRRSWCRGWGGCRGRRRRWGGCRRRGGSRRRDRSGCGRRGLHRDRRICGGRPIPIRGYECVSRSLGWMHGHASRSGDGRSIQLHRISVAAGPGQYRRLAGCDARGRRGDGVRRGVGVVVILGNCGDSASRKRDEAASQSEEGKDRTFQGNSPSVCRLLIQEFAIAVPKNPIFGSCSKYET